MTRDEAISFGRNSAAMAVDQVAEYRDMHDAVASYHENISDTLCNQPELYPDADESFRRVIRDVLGSDFRWD